VAITNNKVYEIYSYNFKSANGIKRALNMWGSSASEGRNVCLYDSDSSNTQRWRALEQSPNHFKLACISNENFVLDRYQTNQNADISANSSRYNSDQIFIFEPRGSSFYIKLASDNRYLTAVNNANGTSSGTSSTSSGNVFLSSSTTAGSIWDVILVSSSSGNTHPAVGTVPANFSSSYYSNPNGGRFSAGQCTWYAWGRAMEKCGVSLTFSGSANGADWYNHVSTSSVVTKVSSPMDNSIGCFNGPTSYGHVVFIEYVENGYVYYTEANAGGTDGIVKQRTVNDFISRNSYEGCIKLG